MIPLVRPKLPEWGLIGSILEKSAAEGKISNFGPCYWELVQLLTQITGRYDVPVTNGTAAIQLAAQTKFKRGSRILCPDYTHIGTVQALVSAGMQPVLAPVSRVEWTLSSSVLITNKNDYDGVIVVSPFGYRVDFTLYDQLCRDLNKPLIYDIAGGFGMKILTKNPVCYSMHATKNLPIGEGGIISFSKVDEADIAFKLCCFDQNVDRTISSPYGSNLKLDEVRAAIAIAQLHGLEAIQDRINDKKALLDLYQSELSTVCIPHNLHHGNSAPSLCVVSGLCASHLETKSKELGFEVKRYYPLLTEMEGLKEIPRIGVSSPFFRTCAALPSDVNVDEALNICELVLSEVKDHHARGQKH